MKINRRYFIKIVAQGAFAFSVFRKPLMAKEQLKLQIADHEKTLSFIKKNGPLNPNLSSEIPSRFFLGEDPTNFAHPLLLKESLESKNFLTPTPTEFTDVVIIGGGMSGLMTAYLLRQRKPIVLEQANRFGGNSKGETWGNIPFSVGAAYFMEQEPGSEIFKLFKEVGAHREAIIKSEEDPVLLNNKMFINFWNGESDPDNKKIYLKLKNFFTDIFNETHGKKYPEMPLPIEVLDNQHSGVAYLKELDQYNFKEYLEKKVLNDQALPAQIEVMLEHYSWSTFATSLKELSAAAGLNAYAAEFGKVYVTPGGNSKVAELFLKKASSSIPLENLRTGSLVLRVEVINDGVLITYSDMQKNIKTIKAKIAVMACPKFVVKHILQGIENDRERLQAINTLKYRSYLVANLLLKKKIKKRFYDAYLLDGDINPEQANFTDAILANYAFSPQKDKGNSSSVLTLYRSFPYEGGRQKLIDQEQYSKIRAEFIDHLEKFVFKSLDITKDDIIDLQITRWGHPMPVPEKGLIHSGVIEKIRKPFKDRVFFIEQDNWMLPAIETCAEESLYWAKIIDKKLEKNTLSL